MIHGEASCRRVGPPEQLRVTEPSGDAAASDKLLGGDAGIGPVPGRRGHDHRLAVVADRCRPGQPGNQPVGRRRAPAMVPRLSQGLEQGLIDLDRQHLASASCLRRQFAGGVKQCARGAERALAKRAAASVKHQFGGALLPARRLVQFCGQLAPVAWQSGVRGLDRGRGPRRPLGPVSRKQIIQDDPPGQAVPEPQHPPARFGRLDQHGLPGLVKRLEHHRLGHASHRRHQSRVELAAEHRRRGEHVAHSRAEGGETVPDRPRDRVGHAGGQAAGVRWPESAPGAPAAASISSTANGSPSHSPSSPLSVLGTSAVPGTPPPSASSRVPSAWARR